MYQDLQKKVLATSPFIMIFQQIEVAGFVRTSRASSSDRHSTRTTFSISRSDPGFAPLTNPDMQLESRRSGAWATNFAWAAGRFILIGIITFLGLIAVTFFIGRVIPIDPALAIVGDRAPAHVVERVREELGLNLPLYEQFFIYVKGVLEGDFGNSVLTTNPVMQDIRRVFPATMELATFGTLIGVGLRRAVGRARRRQTRPLIDQVVRVIGLIGYSVPIFWLGLIGLVVFYAKLGWVGGSGPHRRRLRITFTPITGFYLIDAVLAGRTGKRSATPSAS